MKVKTSELTGDALDWAVAVAANRLGTWIRSPNPKRLGTSIMDIGVGEDGKLHAWANNKGAFEPFTPSTDWFQGGPIIERERIAVLPPITRRIGAERYAFPIDCWRALLQTDENELATHGCGSTPLIAAMRCFVASKLGDEVDVPEELLK